LKNEIKSIPKIVTVRPGEKLFLGKWVWSSIIALGAGARWPDLRPTGDITFDVNAEFACDQRSPTVSTRARHLVT
jgi:hypothetical protein